ncbi:MAG: MBL fold metallo-hydrolase [Phycisphaerales bacterium]|nr:MBL fold metallo-hydrolase [Phycisphaerales bacterium]
MPRRFPPHAIDLGGVRITLLDGGALALDGGAMFGIIPKALWSRAVTADPENRIKLACNCLLVEMGARRVIVETGHGSKYGDKEQKIFAIDPTWWLVPALQDAGVDPATITDVVLTHLHFDHAGGLTWLEGERVMPSFPNAAVHVQEQELTDARANFGIMTATYRAPNLDPTMNWRPMTGEIEILPGVFALLSPGHTRGHHSIRIAGKDRDAVFCGDVMPTAAHVGAPYNMGYDLFPLDNRESKRRILATVAKTDAILVIGHEPNTPLVTVRPDGDWFRLEPLAGA